MTYRKSEEVSGWKTHIKEHMENDEKFRHSEVFVNQNRVNICEQIVRRAPHDSFE